jgi:hypothetical protein
MPTPYSRSKNPFGVGIAVLTAQAYRPPFPESQELLPELGWITGVGRPVAEAPSGDPPLRVYTNPPEDAASSRTLTHFGTGSQAGVARIFVLSAFMPRTTLDFVLVRSTPLWGRTMQIFWNHQAVSESKTARHNRFCLIVRMRVGRRHRRLFTLYYDFLAFVPTLPNASIRWVQPLLAFRDGLP